MLPTKVADCSCFIVLSGDDVFILMDFEDEHAFTVDCGNDLLMLFSKCYLCSDDFFSLAL